MTPEIECSKCGGEMQRGFLYDRGHMEYNTQQVWVEGDPEETFWSGGVKTSGRNAYSVGAYRCGGCGFLDFYATESSDI